MDPRQPDPLWPPPQQPQGWPPQSPPQAPQSWPQAPNPWSPPAWHESPSARRSPYANHAPSHARRNALIAVVVTAILVVTELVVAGSHASKDPANGSPFGGQGQVFTPADPSPSLPAHTGPVGPIPADGVTASTPLAANSGTPVYSDIFDDPDSGWYVDTTSDASTDYGDGDYIMTITGHSNWLSPAPYDVPAQQILLSMQATESGDSTGRAGFGLLCIRGPHSDGMLRYEFIVNGNGRWSIERNQGEVSISSPPTVLDQGTSPQAAGATPTDISAVCATLADGTTTRLALFVAGTEVADITDVGTVDGAGWLGGMISSGTTGETSTATARLFRENQLGTPTQVGSNA